MTMPLALRVRSGLAATAVCAVVTLATTATAGAEPAAGPMQVNWFEAAAYSLAHPDAVPVGMNDFGCRPKPNHPNPVVLVNGAFVNLYANWAMLSPLLAAEGYCVFGTNYGSSPDNLVHQTGDLRESAAELGAFVDRVREATGAPKVDLVGHSEGGLVPLHYLKNLGGFDAVDKMIGIAPITNGVSFYGVLDAVASNPVISEAIDTALPIVTMGTSHSQFLIELAEGGVTRPEVDYTTISSRTDLVVQIAESALPEAPNVRNIVVQDSCPDDHADHNTVVYDDVTLNFVLASLDPTSAPELECHPVLPFINRSPIPPA